MTRDEIKIGQLVRVSDEPRPHIQDRTKLLGKLGLVTYAATSHDWLTVQFPEGEQFNFWPVELDLVSEAKDGIQSR